jgi:RNA recognition motif. (a.k.a. RRM, RBD, or RNP domain)
MNTDQSSILSKIEKNNQLERIKLKLGLRQCADNAFNIKANTGDCKSSHVSVSRMSKDVMITQDTSGPSWATQIKKKICSKSDCENQEFWSQTNKRPKSPSSSDLRVFVKNLSSDITAESLKQYFSGWGKVVDVFIRTPAHKFRGQLCSMGYITFSSYFKESPLTVPIHIINGRSIPIFKVEVQLHEDDLHVGKSKTIMITGPIHNLPKQDLQDYFTKFGKVQSIGRQQDHSGAGKYKRFAFVLFVNSTAADRAMDAPNHIIKGQIVDARRVQDR